MIREEHELLKLVDNIFANRGLRVRVEGVECLRDEKIYLQMCKVLFPSQNTKLRSLSDRNMPTGAKIQTLIDYISEETGMELSHISGDNIAKGRKVDIFNILEFLQQVSRPVPHPDGQPQSGSEPFDSAQPDSDDYQAGQHLDKQISKQSSNSGQQKLIGKKQPRRDESSSSQSLTEEQQPNFQQQILNQVREVKEQLLKASYTENKKDKNMDVKNVKNKYKAYLKDLIVDKKVEQNINKHRKQSKTIKKKTVAYYAIKEAEEIDSNQKSMGLKLRDNKDRYMRKIKQLVYGLERERIHEEGRQQRIIEKEIEKNTRHRMESLHNQNERHREILKETNQQTRANCSKQQRQNRKLIAESQRRLKQHFHTQRNRLRSSLHQQNNRLLQVFEEDGGLEQIIVGMYKKY